MNTNIEESNIAEFKESLRKEIDNASSENLKNSLWKILITTEVANRSISLKTKIEPFEKDYFDRYTGVARYFRDWGMDWVADGYKAINEKIMKDFWP
jgi:hypothetical protein